MPAHGRRRWRTARAVPRNWRQVRSFKILEGWQEKSAAVGQILAITGSNMDRNRSITGKIGPDPFPGHPSEEAGLLERHLNYQLIEMNFPGWGSSSSERSLP